jgi:hypothetical protein
VEDYQHKLPPPFHPAVLTAVLVTAGGSATFIRDPGHNPRFPAALRKLAAAPTPGAP